MDQLDIDGFLQTGFCLKEHLARYLDLNLDELDSYMVNAPENISRLHPGSMTKLGVTAFYEEKVGNAHLFDLASWHLGSAEYIADTLRLVEMFSNGKVLDFGGGIGTHSLFAASLGKVEHVYFVDLNPQNREFVRDRARSLGLCDEISVHRDIESTNVKEFQTLICFDVLEHLADPSEQLLKFKNKLSNNSVALMNWYFFKGNQGEYPFHFDDKEMIEKFFQTLQSNFSEIFHPFLITARTYKPNK